MEMRKGLCSAACIILLFVFTVIQTTECNPRNQVPISPVGESIESPVSSPSPGSPEEASVASRLRKKRGVQLDDETERLVMSVFRTDSEPSEQTRRRQPISQMDRSGNSNSRNSKSRNWNSRNSNSRNSTGAKRALCEDRSYCNRVQDYPTDIINAALRSDTTLQYYQIRDEIYTDPNEVLLKSPDDTLCHSRKSLQRLQGAKNMNNEWRYIINTDQFVQAVAVEICLGGQTTCNMVDTASGYTTMCKQNYITRQLQALGENNRIIMDRFPIPSSCCCQGKFVGSERHEY